MDTLITLFIGCLPSAITGFCFWLIQSKIKKGERKREEAEKKRHENEEKREQLREQQELFLIQGMNAAIALGEATAKAVQRIPDAHCNGDMHAALNYAEKVKHEHRDFLAKQGVMQLHE